MVEGREKAEPVVSAQGISDNMLVDAIRRGYEDFRVSYDLKGTDISFYTDLYLIFSHHRQPHLQLSTDSGHASP